MDKELKHKLKEYSDIFKDAQEKGKKEADVIMYIVQFFKDALGYDVFKEISKEYQIKGGYCDIGIKIKGKLELLIEAKQPGLILADRHIKQAEIYAAKSGTKWVILTNGCVWKLFHLSFDEEEGIERSLVFKTDFLKSFQEKPDYVIEKFKLLHKKNFTKGELDKFWKKKTMLIPRSLSKALFKEEVLKKIRQEVNRGKEVKVGIEDIAKALKNMFDKEVLADMAEIKIDRKKKKKQKKVFSGKLTEISYIAKKPAKVKLLNEPFEVKSWRELLITAAERLMKHRPDAFNNLPDSEIMKGKKAPYLTNDKSLLRTPYQLSSGLFIETNLNANAIVQVIKILLKGCGYKETNIKIFTKD